MIRKLNFMELEMLYRQHMMEDFPREECKPLELLKRLYDEKKNCTLGWYEDEALKAYAILEKADKGNVWLLDYLAVPHSIRGKGYGGTMLRCIQKELSQADAVLLEIERLDQAKNEAQYQERLRRKLFYIKNGALETGVFTRADGNIDYEILCLPVARSFAGEDARRAMHNIYETFFEKGTYEVYQ